MADLAKAVTILGTMAILAPLMAAAGLVMFALGPYLILALLGLNNMQVFIKGSSWLIAEAIKNLSAITISDPKKIEKTLDIVTKVIQAVALLADIGMKAMKISMSASMPFFGSGKPADHMNSMSKFINDILGKSGEGGGGIVGAVDQMVTMAGKFDEKALKGAEAIAGIIGAIGGLAGALIEPLTNMSANAGNWYGGGKGDDMQKMVSSVGKGVGTILSAMKTSLVGSPGKPGLIEELIGLFDSPSLKKHKPEVLQKRADTLKSLFEAILAIVKAMSELQKFEKEDTSSFWEESNAVSMKEALEKMFTNVNEVLTLKILETVVQNAVKMTEWVTGDAKGLKGKADALKAVFEGMKAVIMSAGDLGHWFGDLTDKKGGAWGLYKLRLALDNMESANYLPSQVIPRIVNEATKIAKKMRRMKYDFGKVKLKQQLNAIMGYDGEHVITIAPEAVNLQIRLQVKIDAETLAIQMAKGTYTKWDGFFKRTEKVNAKRLELGIY